MNPDSASPVVVKVGGSLFDLPDLGPRLRAWLEMLETRAVLLVPGGGATADVVRDFDCVHHLGEEPSHWLALRALSFNAHFLAVLLQAVVIEHVEAAPACWQAGDIPILDGYRFALQDEGRRGALPHSWSVTSDSIAARVALLAHARRLVLLKSVTISEATSWADASRAGWVDGWFPAVAGGLEVRCVNFRAWTPDQSGREP
jgi:aspartokinase-like uncharacterized kinase